MLRGLDIEAGTTVWFMVLDSSSWKYTEIYQAFIQDSRFSVYVCVVPNNWHGSERELRAVREVEMLTGSGVTAVLWDANTMSPGSNDIILLLNPHENLYPKGLVRTWMRLCSTIYIPYTFWLAQQWESLVFRTRIHRTAALVLYESKEHLALAQDGQRYAAKNGIAIGYPGFSLPSVGPLAPNQDRLRDKGDRPQIVWAPHHSIDVFSTFLAWHDYMLEVAQRHNSYQVIFRPHPVLLPKLSVLWGKTKLDKYLSAWSNSASGDVSFGPQELLFKRSTAMIHDSLGFMAEYVSTGRPTAYLTDDLIESVNRLNRAGKILLNCHTIVQSQPEFVAWMENVLAGNQWKSDALATAERDYFAPSRSGVGSRLIAELAR